ncbi:MAG TPA: hypothetical protein V6C95_07610 [Coleofasciculaceae cyanobacterium]
MRTIIRLFGIEEIAIAYEWVSERDLALQVTLLPEQKCRRG